MRITPRMLAAAEKALGREVGPEELKATLEHFEEHSVRDLRAALRAEREDFESKGGRDVDQADFIDGLNAVIAVRILPKDPKEWSPRKGKGPKMGAGPKEWRPGPGRDVVVVLDDMERVRTEPDAGARLYSAGVYPWKGDPGSVKDEAVMDGFVEAVQAKDMDSLFRSDQDQSAVRAIDAAHKWADSHGYRVLSIVKLY